MLRRLLIGAWMCATLLALLAMFKLWGTREWRLYGGKSVAEQREAVFRQTGFDAYLLRDAVDLAAAQLIHLSDDELIGPVQKLVEKVKTIKAAIINDAVARHVRNGGRDGNALRMVLER